MKINNNVVDNKIGEETVLLNLTTGHYFVLNESGAFVWNELKNNSDKSEITKSLSENYDVTEDEATADIDALFTTLKSKDLIA